MTTNTININATVELKPISESILTHVENITNTPITLDPFHTNDDLNKLLDSHITNYLLKLFIPSSPPTQSTLEEKFLKQ